jgi:glycosyltransferase involved in cell wall biosynthesis
MKVQLLARPDHALFLYKYLKNLITVNMVNFNVTKKDSLIHLLRPRTKLVDKEVVVLDDFTLFDQLLFALAKMGLKNPYRLESVYSNFSFAMRAKKFAPDLIHYWPIYCHKYVTQQRIKKNIVTVADVYSAHSSHVLEILKPEYERYNLDIGNSYFFIARDRDHEFLNNESNIITNSSYVKQSFQKFSPNTNISVAEYGFLGDVNVANNYKASVNKQQGKNTSTLRLIYVGTISIEKGVHYLMDAITKLNSSFIQLDLIGSIKRGQEKVFNEYTRLKNVNFLGHKSNTEVKSILPGYSLLIHPSLSDAYSIAVIEALQCALPVIVTDYTGNKDSVAKYEVGEVIKAGDSESIIVAIEKMLSQEYRIFLSQNIQKFIADDLMYPYPLKVLDIYKELLATNTGRKD